VLTRGSLQSQWDAHRGRLITTYRNGDFERSLMVEVDRADSEPEFANGGILFRIALDTGASWHTCLLWRPAFGQERAERAPDDPFAAPHAAELMRHLPPATQAHVRDVPGGGVPLPDQLPAEFAQAVLEFLDR